MLPEFNRLPKTVFKLLQYAKKAVPSCDAIRHFYCKQCLYYNGSDPSVEKCGSCEAGKDKISFFFEFDVGDQIRDMFETRNLADKLKQRTERDSNIIADLTDGSEYIKVNSRLGIGQYDFTLILNLDGLSMVKSSSSHCWPLMCTIAELPEHLRESFLFVIGIWYDSECKPKMNTFLEPFCKKLRDCYTNGVTWTHPVTKEINISKIVAPLIIADAPARAQVQNIMNFNGRYGCNICEIRMRKCKPIETKKTTRIYGFENSCRLRTGERMEQQGLKVENSGKVQIRGVKGLSQLSMLPLIDLGTCVLPEYMHSVLLGVVKQFTNVWLYKSGPWSLKNCCNKINSFLKSIRPLDSFGRMPRNITDIHFYKASEFYNWLILYSAPALFEHLPNEYFQHWLLLIIALFTMLGDKIRVTPDLEQAEILLRLFVEQVEHLYSDRELTYNVHQLLHLGLCVRRWGPPWATSAFIFENYNGFLANCTHGNKHIGQELINNLTIGRGVQILKSLAFDSNVAARTSCRDKNTFRLLGKAVNIIWTDIDRQLLLAENLNLDRLNVFSRVQINGETYTSTSYKIIKTNNYTVEIIMECGSTFYGKIKFYFELENDLGFIMQCISVQHTKMFCHDRTRALVKHIMPIIEVDDFSLVKLSEINP